MIQSKCAICNDLITENNNSKEHIIPNSIGGRKVVKNFICNDCNNFTGETWDSELFKQLAPFCTMFGIERHRGEVTPLKVKTYSGEEFLQFNNGTFQPLRPKFSAVEKGKKLEITIQARTKQQAEQCLKKIAKDHQLSLEDEENIRNKSEIRNFYLDEPIGHELNIDSETVGKSMVKSALALAHDGGIISQDCEIAIDYLNSGSSLGYKFYYEKDILKNRHNGLPLHCIKIQANSSTKQVLGYVEYFGCLRLIIFLSEFYQGENKEISYAINPMDGKELNLEINLNFTEADINKIKKSQYNIKNFELAFGAILQKAVSFSEERELKRVIQQAFEYAKPFDDSQKNEDENLSFMASKFNEAMQPYIKSKVLSRFIPIDRKI